MLVFAVNDLSKRFGDTLLFENVNFSINPGDRVGLVGPNGSGKSTLLRVLVGELPRDRGAITIAPGATVGYLRQGFSDIPDGTLADLLDIPTNGLLSALDRLNRTTGDLADAAVDPDSAATAFEDASAQFEALGGYVAMDELEALLDRFGLGEVALSRSLDALSGGQKTRAGLAALLSSGPDLLVLDEPTNHLDRDALAWLAEFLEGYPGAVLIVSHDRGFLDRVVSRIFAIDPATQSLGIYAGNYSDYAAAKRHEEDEAEAGWKRQQLEVQRINRDIRAAESKARNIEASTIDYAVRKKAAKIARPAVVRKKKLERMLESEDAAQRPERHWSMALDFPDATDGARDVMRLDGVSAALGGRSVLENVDLLIRHGERIALLGANGSGKTTLLRVMTGDLTPDSGEVRVGSGVRIGYLAQEQQTLELEWTILEQASRVATMSESDMRTFLHKFLFGGDTVHRKIGDLSYGERTRLMLALLALRETSLLLLDEPLNHLDIEAREEFEQALSQFRGAIVMVLHDEYSVERLATRVIELRSGQLVETHMVMAG